MTTTRPLAERIARTHDHLTALADSPAKIGLSLYYQAEHLNAHLARCEILVAEALTDIPTREIAFVRRAVVRPLPAASIYGPSSPDVLYLPSACELLVSLHLVGVSALKGRAAFYMLHATPPVELPSPLAESVTAAHMVQAADDLWPMVEPWRGEMSRVYAEALWELSLAQVEFANVSPPKAGGGERGLTEAQYAVVEVLFEAGRRLKDLQIAAKLKTTPAAIRKRISKMPEGWVNDSKGKGYSLTKMAMENLRPAA